MMKIEFDIENLLAAKEACNCANCDHCPFSIEGECSLADTEYRQPWQWPSVEDDKTDDLK